MCCVLKGGERSGRGLNEPGSKTWRMVLSHRVRVLRENAETASNRFARAHNRQPCLNSLSELRGVLLLSFASPQVLRGCPLPVGAAALVWTLLSGFPCCYSSLTPPDCHPLPCVEAPA
jgi:hypothetical protein